MPANIFVMDIILLFFCCFQESGTDHRVNEIGDECAEADI